MEFKEFNGLLEEHIDEMTKGETHLFVVDYNGHKLWNLYLDSFPEGTNSIFRERREFDCTCCSQFVRALGNVVAIKNNQIVTIWDFETNSDKYQPVLDALSKAVHDSVIKDVFVTDVRKFGTKSSKEINDDGSHTWYHMYGKVASTIKTVTGDLQMNAKRGEMNATHGVFKRSLEEISMDSIKTVLELTAQKSLYKGKEWEAQLKKLLNIQKTYDKLAPSEQEGFLWKTSVEVGPALGRIKNHSIGTLLTDISEGMELDGAVKKFEKMVAPANYKRPNAIFTKKMVEAAQKKVKELGLQDSMGRRYAEVDDITVNNILFANKDTLKVIEGDVFDDLASETSAVSTKSFDKVEEVAAETFIKDILPNATELEVLLENKHNPNMVSLVAPKVKDCKTMFKWDNNFSWAYRNNITDSDLREQVRNAGGRVDGVLRFSFSWNHDGKNQSLMDLHVFMPGCGYTQPKGSEVHDRYPSTFRRVGWNCRKNTSSGGVQDVDNTDRPGKRIPVENITFPSMDRLPEGKYYFKVHNWSARTPNTSGFKAEVELNGEVYSFEYDQRLNNKEWVTVGEATLKNGVFTFEGKLPSNRTSVEMWGLDSNQFHPVSTCMFSPNYWDEQQGIGHKHYFFMLKDCLNTESPNGFFNEFLKEELNPHRKVFEALGSKMSVEDSDNQLSGLGFSSTKRANLIVKVKGSFTRTLKVMF